jgi:hypothetical protein
LKVDGDQKNPPMTINKHHNNIPSIPADAVYESGSVDEYATLVYANSTKTAYIDPRDWNDLLRRAVNDILQTLNASAP